MSGPAVGAAAVIGAILAFGTFGAPIKSQRLRASQVHPLVVQGYKSAACFGTCWVALLWVPLKFTWWGTLGAAIWVMNGVAAVVAIQAAGLAVSQALWSGISIVVAFLWGAVVFREPVAIPALAITGLFLMACGMGAIGVVVGKISNSMEGTGVMSPLMGLCSDEAVVSRSDSNGSSDKLPAVSGEAQNLIGGHRCVHSGSRSDAGDAGPSLNSKSSLTAPTEDNSSLSYHTSTSRQCLHREGSMTLPEWQTSSCLRWQPSYSVGIACAVFIGIANGSFMVPFKYASRSVTGLEYLVSFGVGAAGVSCCAMVMYAYTARNCHWQPLQLKLRQAGPPALLAGLLWSCGNLFSIIATQELGMSVAWPAVQTQLLVSTAWGALWYREICDVRQRAVLLGATAVIILGVVCLAIAKGA